MADSITQQLPPFLRCPLEIRLQIYSYLLIEDPILPRIKSDVHYHEYEPSDSTPPTTPTTQRILSFRNMYHTDFNAQAHLTSKRRSTYRIRTDRFRHRTVEITYHCINVPLLHTNILTASRQIHAEAARLLYSTYTFDFDSHIEALEPFCADLTPYSRSFVRRISLVKKALPYDKDFDRCEWSSMCGYVAENLHLHILSLGVVSGKPTTGWDMIEQIPENEFGPIVTRHKRDEMEWVRDLMGIKGLKGLDVRACIEHCPHPGSSAMMFFVAFSASVASGFTKYLMKQMVPAV